MPDLNEFTLYMADCTQNPENCLYPHKVVVRTAAEANEVFKKDHVSAKFKGDYRSNDNFEKANCVNMDSDNKDIPDPKDWMTGEDIHRIMPDVPMIISDSKNNMKPKKDEPPAPRNHAFIRIDPVTSAEEFAKLKERLYKHYPFFDPKALDAAHYFDGTENPNARIYPGTITLQEHLARLEAIEQTTTEQAATEPDFDEVIPEGSRNSTMFHFAVRTLKRYGNTEDARERFRNKSEKCVSLLDKKELNGIWKSVLKYYGRIKQQPGYVPPEQYNAPKEIQWEPPIPFDEVQLPPFPTEALPSRVRPYVEAVAETTQTPIDMAGTAVLITMASCIQGKYRIKAKPDWEEPLCLYGIIVADPSERKSAVNSFSIRPLNLFEMEYNKLNAASLEKNRMQKRILEKKQQAVEDKFAKGKAEEGELEAIVEEVANFKEKAPMQLYVDDVTPEKLVSVMADHDGVASIISAEGGIFDQLAGGMYSKTVNIDVFLKGHAGDTIRIDRIGRNSESIERPTLTMLLAVQPNVLSGLIQNGTFRGRGLTARFLYTMPSPMWAAASTAPSRYRRKRKDCTLTLSTTCLTRTAIRGLKIQKS